ncbi:MAG TPA: Crp/Fnr family transcriptional regulator [Burkholderiaceae bacterium]|nr:Crp/Fnr family transcriptional regulator [Burkholderiaceae bacterium]
MAPSASTPAPRREHALKALRATRWFAELPEDALQELAQISRFRRMKDGQLLVHRGAQPDGLAIILEGEIRSRSFSLDGHEIVFSMLRAGTVWGLVAVLDGLGAVHDATAHGDTHVLIVPRLGFLRILGQRPELYRHFVPMLCYRLRKAYTAVNELALAPVRQRLARQLCALAVSDEREQPARALSLTQSDLAVLLGVTRPSVNRALKEFEREGLIELGYARVTVRDFAALHRVCADPQLFAL